MESTEIRNTKEYIGMVAEELQRLKQRENAVILAHYYVDGQVQAMADYVGDSYYLAKIAARSDKQTIVFCGVRFMGESAKILNPSRRVLLPDAQADCPMAHMARAEDIRRLRAEIPNLAVVCYINSTAALKAESDVCVTSSNALKIVSALPNQDILFIPDDNLGHYIAARLPEKRFHYLGGHCPVHSVVLAQDVESEKLAHPAAKVLTHPECRGEVRALSDFVGSTSEIISFAEKSDAKEFILCTEPGVLYELSLRCAGKKFYPVTPLCLDMKLVTPEKVLACLNGGGFEVKMGEEEMNAARRPLERMLELAK